MKRDKADTALTLATQSGIPLSQTNPTQAHPLKPIHLMASESYPGLVAPETRLLQCGEKWCSHLRAHQNHLAGSLSQIPRSHTQSF